MVLSQKPFNKKWDRSATVIEVGANRQYRVKMDGSGRISARNRRHLQKILPKILPGTPILASDQPREYPHVPLRSSMTSSPNCATLPVTSNVTGQDIGNDTCRNDNVIPPLRRSTRTSKAPIRYHDEY